MNRPASRLRESEPARSAMVDALQPAYGPMLNAIQDMWQEHNEVA